MQMRYVLLPFLGALCLALAACSVTYGNKSVASPEVYGWRRENPPRRTFTTRWASPPTW